MPYISAETLPNLRKYKYSAVDLSPVSKYILQPYWNRLVLLFPLSVAPNLITLLGFICILANTLTLIYFSPDLLSPCPDWVYFTFALGLFVYQSLDAIDGKQARRTGTSSPLGQLFDHGCDALNTSLGVILGASALNLGPSWLSIVSLSASLANFYITTWEEYHTGTLYLGHFSGPTEGVLSLVAVYLWTAFKGPLWWSGKAVDVVPLPQFLSHIKLNELLVYTVVTIIIPVLFTSFINVRGACKANRKSFLVALLGIVPFVFFVFTIYTWLYYSPYILKNHIIAFMLFAGAAFGNVVGKLIVAHVVHDKYPYFNTNYILLGLGASLAALNQRGYVVLTRDQEVLLVYACLVISSVIHGHFVMSIIDQICAYLDINCLTIKETKEPKNKKK